MTDATILIIDDEPANLSVLATLLQPAYKVLARLKKNPATTDIPVIFVTAMSAEEDEKRGLDLGAGLQAGYVLYRSARDHHRRARPAFRP